MIRVSVIGATAYTSRELLGILARHPGVELVHLGGRREERPRVSEVFTSLRGLCDLRVIGMEPQEAPQKPDAAFFTLPHKVSMQYVPRYLEAGVRCIDLSADYRLRDVAVYEAWYAPHEDQANLSRAVYGLPELWREPLRGAELAAVAGCYPTAAALALAPLLAEGAIDPGDIVVDAKSGVSGRGNKPNEGSMFCECNEDVRAYSVAGHRHEPEIEQSIEMLGGAGASVTFVPHLVPMDRGILSTAYARLTSGLGGEELQALFERFYEGEPFVRVLPAGEQPRTKDVTLTNFCDVAVMPRPGRRVVVTSAIDNLMKGASSQAVQCLNVMFGLEETAGLV